MMWWTVGLILGVNLLKGRMIRSGHEGRRGGEHVSSEFKGEEWSRREEGSLQRGGERILKVGSAI